MITQIYAANGGQPTVSNPKMRRMGQEKKTTSSSPAPFDSMDHTLQSTTCSSADSTNSTNSTPTKLPNHVTEKGDSNESSQGTKTVDGKLVRDPAYYERRRKNNAAAKKSRDRRRIKEDEIAIRAAFLERENIELKFELATARKQLALYGIGRA